MRRLDLVALVMAVVLTGCEKDPASPVQQDRNKVTVQGGGFAELCFDARKDDEIIFRFEADQPLQFNFHYHIEEVVYYPIPEHETSAEKGVYLVPKDETYCLMWTNTSATNVTLSAHTEGTSNQEWYLSGH